MYQTVIIAGNLGQDPEMRYTGDGTPVTHFSVATNRRWTNRDGTPGEETTWFRVTAWRRLAETCNEYLRRGRAVIVEGQLNVDPATGGPRVWTGNDGVPRASFEITARVVRFMGGRGDTVPLGPPESDLEAPPEGDIPF